jgi:hypothetical protein
VAIALWQSRNASSLSANRSVSVPHPFPQALAFQVAHVSVATVFASHLMRKQDRRQRNQRDDYYDAYH